MLHQIWYALEFGEDHRRAIEQKYCIQDEKKNVVIALVGSGVESSHCCFRDMETELNLISRKHEAKFLSLPYHRKVFGLWNLTRDAKQEVGHKVGKRNASFHDYNYSKDITGHETACASVAAGVPHQFKPLSMLEGVSSSTIYGANPNARIVSYKVWSDVGTGEMSLISNSVMKMFDKIIVDQPDIVSVSFGSYQNRKKKFLSDPFSRGALLAFDKNITTCQAVRIETGCYRSYSIHGAPWVLSVGACTPGGRFETDIQIEDTAEKFVGFCSLNKETDFHDLVLWKSKKVPKHDDKMSKMLKLVNEDDEDYDHLSIKELKPKLQGRIVLYADRQNLCVKNLEKVGVRGIIKAWNVSEVIENDVTSKVPVVNVSYGTGLQIIHSYLASRDSKKPLRIKFQKTMYSQHPCALWSKSAVGPHDIDRNILKPDVCAYGDMLTASTWNDENGYGNFKFSSGTSIASAMVAGVASYIKSIHKEWDPSRIKSAIMSTATEIPAKNIVEFLGVGAGCVNPADALDPGLSYDMETDDYIQYLIKLGEDVEVLGFENPPEIGDISGMNLNTCSFTTELKHHQGKYIFKRRLTNLCPRPCVYEGKIIPDAKFPYNEEFVSFEIHPNPLVFSGEGNAKDFKLIVTKKIDGLPIHDVLLEYARLVWMEINDKTEADYDLHTVSSPIVLTYPENIYSQSEIAHDSKKRERSPDEPSGGPTKKHKLTHQRGKGKEPMQKRTGTRLNPSRGPVRIK